MEYERIRKVQLGVMSPSKLRMKLLGSHGSSKKEDASKSPRASPSRLADGDHLKNSLLAQELDEDYPKDRSDSSRSRSDASHGRSAHAGGGNSDDSGNESGGNFEFHRGERAAQQQPPPLAAAAAAVAPFFRQVPSKWNDAEKWIAGRHVVHSNPIFSKKAAALHGQSGGVRVAPEYVVPSSSDAKKSGASSESLASRALSSAVGSALTELSSSSSPPSVSGPASKQHPHKKRFPSDTSTVTAPAVQSVSMRDVGTEMTPIASQEQSRSGTPVGATTPSLSPLCSVPSSPKGSSSAVASERELQIRTRQEIAALGLQLGKMKIASWASKEDPGRVSPEKNSDEDEAAKKAEFEARAVAWEESQKCKLASRYQRKEAKIQEWESCQKSKFEARMRHAEVQAEKMKARAKSSLTRRLSTVSHKAEGKQARVETRRSRQAARLARQVERIRATGRLPSRLRCCSWFL